MDHQQRQILKELIKRRRRPYLYYQPAPTQKRFMESPKLYKALHGPNRGGKTFHIDMELAMLLEDKHHRIKNARNRKFLFVLPGRQNSKVHKEYFTERSRLRGPLFEEPMLNMDETKVVLDKKSEPHALRMLINTRTGNSVLFIWAGAGSRTQNLLEGDQFDGAILDESAGTQHLLDEVYLRLLDAQSDPERPNYGFIWWSFTETKVNQAGTSFLANCYDDSKTNYQAFRIEAGENPVITKAARDDMGQGMSDKAKRIRIDGTSSAQGEVSIYPVMVTKKDKLIRTSCYQPGQDDNIVLGFDPGVDHPCGLVFAYLNRYRPRNLQVFKSICRSGEGPGDAVQHIADTLQGRKLAMLAYDPFGASRREYGTGKSAIQLLMELIPESWWAPGFANIKQPKGRHLIGINAVRSYLDPHYSISPDPLIQFDPATDDNGMGMAIAQMTEYRGREDLNFAGIHGVVKMNDEFPDCVAEGQLVSTQRGNIPIEQVCIGDYAMTRVGPRRVTDHWMAHPFRDCIELTLLNGNSIVATADHMVMTSNGWKSIDSIGYTDMVWTWKQSTEPTVANATTHSKTLNTTTSGTGKGNYCTDTFMSTKSVRYQKDAISTTKTVTCGTTPLTTLRRFLRTSTTNIITKILRRVRINLNLSAPWLLRGTEAKRALSGTHRMQSKHSRNGHTERQIASSAEKGSPIAQYRSECSAQTGARQPIESPAESTTPSAHVPSVETTSPSTSTQCGSFVLSAVLSKSDAGKRPVYDISVDGQHEFVAGGVLVHNCLRYLVLSNPVWEDYGPNIISGVKKIPSKHRDLLAEQGAKVADLTDDERRMEQLMKRSAEIAQKRSARRRR